jgi:hypothetical protein
MHILTLALALSAAPALAQEPAEAAAPEPTPAPGRLLLNTAVVGTGLGLAGAAVYNLTQAREAYQDYLDSNDQVAADALLHEEVRPRQVAGITEAGLAVVALGSGALLWASTDGLEPLPAAAPRARYALNTAVLGAGAGLGVAAAYDYGRSHGAYRRYLETTDGAAAQAIYDDELIPLRRAMLTEGLLSVTCLGVGAALWARTDVQVSAGPGAVGFSARF